jgi:hypothetical protein
MIRVEREIDYDDYEKGNLFFINNHDYLVIAAVDANGDAKDIAMYAEDQWQSVRNEPVVDEDWPQRPEGSEESGD